MGVRFSNKHFHWAVGIWIAGILIGLILMFPSLRDAHSKDFILNPSNPDLRESFKYLGYRWLLINYLPLSVWFIYLTIVKSKQPMNINGKKYSLPVFTGLFIFLVLVFWVNRYFFSGLMNEDAGEQVSKFHNLHNYFRYLPFVLLPFQVLIFYYMPRPAISFNPLTSQVETLEWKRKKRAVLQKHLDELTIDPEEQFVLKNKIEVLDKEIDELKNLSI